MPECPATPGSDDDDRPTKSCYVPKEKFQIVQKRDLPPFKWLTKNKARRSATPTHSSRASFAVRVPRGERDGRGRDRHVQLRPVQGPALRRATLLQLVARAVASSRRDAMTLLSPCRAMNFECIKGYCPVERAGFKCENQRFQHSSWRPKIEVQTASLQRPCCMSCGPGPRAMPIFVLPCCRPRVLTLRNSRW